MYQGMSPAIPSRRIAYVYPCLGNQDQPVAKRTKSLKVSYQPNDIYCTSEIFLGFNFGLKYSLVSVIWQENLLFIITFILKLCKNHVFDVHLLMMNKKDHIFQLLKETMHPGK